MNKFLDNLLIKKDQQIDKLIKENKTKDQILEIADILYDNYENIKTKLSKI